MKYAAVNLSYIAAVVVAHAKEGSQLENTKKAVGVIAQRLKDIGL